MNSRIAIILALTATCIAACNAPVEIPFAATTYESKGLDNDVRFAPIHIRLESDQPVAAYQVEIVVTSGEAEIVGVEGSTHPGFKDAPFYDPTALAGGRIIIAALSTDHSIPTGNQRIATLHMRESGNINVKYEVRTIAIADKDGNKLNAQAFATGQ